MMLSVLKPHVLAQYRSGPIPPDRLSPVSYVAVSHLDMRGRFPLSEMLSGDSMGALAAYAVGLEMTEKGAGVKWVDDLQRRMKR